MRGKWIRGLGLGFTHPVATGKCLGCCGVGCVGGELIEGLDQGLEGCSGVMYV